VRYRQALLLSALAVAPAIHAETLYVIEQLVVNVNNAPDSTGTRVTTIKSGEAVEVLDRQGDQVHVHLPNGTDGWVRKSYLSTEEPLQHRLAERNTEVEKLKQDVARLEGELATARGGGRGGKTGIAQANSASPSAAAAPADIGAASKTSAAPANTEAASKAAAPTAASPETNSADNDPASGEPAYFMTPPEAPARPVWHWAVASFVVALGLGFVLGWYGLDRRIRRKYGGLRIY
jgi:SH3 domain protein